ncbi:MAG: hypothetical protein KDB40_08975 [Acidimicrobiales bacterium]|nr:hypothetical protein [Acidimicrobiales bacterium]
MKISLTLDAADPLRLAEFWTAALGYVAAPPPAGWASWETWLRDMDVPEAEWNDGAAIVDPAGDGPSISIVRVPEPKSAKNRLHLDIHATPGRHLEAAARATLIDAKVAELLAIGGSVVERHCVADVLDHVVLRDPEGNEFCIV